MPLHCLTVINFKAHCMKKMYRIYDICLIADKFCLKYSLIQSVFTDTYLKLYLSLQVKFLFIKRKYGHMQKLTLMQSSKNMPVMKHPFAFLIRNALIL
jgi:hypothetical protein